MPIDFKAATPHHLPHILILLDRMLPPRPCEKRDGEPALASSAERRCRLAVYERPYLALDNLVDPTKDPHGKGIT
ncbi:hypothetical protein HGRIS_002957 [Hohenbuehelia grisea]|uniref:Uncharacterized protein n=1 Tax=Hohenbuehelia grisea TaxID=104357 RepID=A0ABR3JM22_9AGAR